jgi:hypothetical protein
MHGEAAALSGYFLRPEIRRTMPDESVREWMIVPTPEAEAKE